MSLQTRLGDFITAVGTDYKNFMTFLTGSAAGSLSGLNTTSQNVKGAINELEARPTGGTPADASETEKGIAELATQAETTTGTDDLRIVTPLKLAQKLTAWAQPLSSNLTDLSGQASTAYGRGFLALANQAGLVALLPNASETAVGLSEIATQAETNTGTDDFRYVTPLKFQTRMAAFAVPLTYLDTDVALAANSDTKVATQKATKAYADSLLDANNAYQYKGAIDASTNPNYPAASAGHTYKISVAGKIGGASGPNVEAGDTITALVDASADGNHATVGANWIIVQTNIDGAVVGPASSTAGNLATFSGTTGKVIQDSGVSVDTDGTMAANSNARVPSQAAVRTYTAANFYTETELGNPETDLAALYATAKA